MKALLGILGILFSLVASAQTRPSVVLPGKQLSFNVHWTRQVGAYVQSNRITRVGLTTVNQYWVGDVTNLTISLPVTEAVAKWTMTVSTLGIILTSESVAVQWPPPIKTNIAITVSSQQLIGSNWSNLGSFLSVTNPPGIGFYRVWHQPTNKVFTTSLWIVQRSDDLRRWTNQGTMYVAPESAKFRTVVDSRTF